MSSRSGNVEERPSVAWTDVCRKPAINPPSVSTSTLVRSTKRAQYGSGLQGLTYIDVHSVMLSRCTENLSIVPKRIPRGQIVHYSPGRHVPE
ncbi:hypothetical protein AG1IA_07674 [Rhizoctonia solani AG-1 IA]|uniref:Uncharacterized protein n=1 Tax=Thanatephorus cucumeris (strain AG1-IA) TaxID=983506 RepID=L8WK71_THACA|nr:hypothetical protein AG1IA_07674 [Rhizoctonia solani AG-1 IA]